MGAEDDTGRMACAGGDAAKAIRGMHRARGSQVPRRHGELPHTRRSASSIRLAAQMDLDAQTGVPVVNVVALSGGKDSTAMALRLAEIEPREYTYICTPTGDELPEMFAHWRRLAELLGQPILPIIGGTLKRQVEHWNALPNWRQRWCTRTLKIEPFAAWLMKQPKPVTCYIGLRADEPDRDGGDYASVPQAVMRYPMREWNWCLTDVLAYLACRNVTIPERTDCARCFFQTLGQ